MRGVPSTVALLIVAIGLGAYIYFVESKRDPASDVPPSDRVFDVDTARIEELRVRADSDEVSVLRRTDGRWQVVEPDIAAADESEVTGITSGLEGLEIQRVVDDEPADLAPFGLDEPRIEVAFRQADEPDFRRLLIGERTATGSDLYAKRDDEPRVFLIAGWLDSTFNRTPFDLRDKTILTFDRDAVDRLEIAGRDEPVELRKADGQWRLARPLQARADFGTVESLLSRVGTGRMRAIVAEDAADGQAWGLDRPELTITVSAGSARSTLLVGRTSEEGTVYARDGSRALIFTIDSSLVDDLRKSPADFRRRDVFEFRTFNTTRVDVTRADGRTTTYEKEGDDFDAGWHRVEATGRVELDNFASVLSRFAGLRILDFLDSADGHGLDTPFLAMHVRFDDGQREERVEFGRNGEHVYARRDDEPGVARVDTTDFDLAVRALDELE